VAAFTLRRDVQRERHQDAGVNPLAKIAKVAKLKGNKISLRDLCELSERFIVSQCGTAFQNSCFPRSRIAIIEAMPKSFQQRVEDFLQRFPHPYLAALNEVLGGKTSVSTSGFPYISQPSFRAFLQNVPHLFQDGQALLHWLSKVEGALQQE